MKIALINGPNLNLLGTREPEIYGGVSFKAYFERLQARFPQLELVYFQSNVEGLIVDRLQECLKDNTAGIVLNAAAYTHTSIAIADAITAIRLPVVEVHISNIMAREEFRKTSVIAAKCAGSISGLGLEGYALAIQYLTHSFSVHG